MSRIDKLAILGVRSFDNTRSETIQFHTPLTLIVGYNGSGKTTIIECLKYATTGQLPPNSKGGAFVHDPKMCGEKEVLAQVKLSFKSINGAKMVCTRSLQLTVKKATRSVKSLEGQLLVVRNGERSTISSRCAELDTVMPQYLGVSKAVLDYVIFCHQDESLWPMSEPSVLKKRFDEIFEALKYTKAIENIKYVTKTQKTELGKLKILLEQYRTDKDRGERAKRRSDELHEEIEDMRGKVELLTEDMRRIGREQSQLWDKAKGFEETIAVLRAKKQESTTMQAHLEDMSKHMKHLTEGDEELLKMQGEWSARLAAYNGHIEEQKRKYRQAQGELENARAQLNVKLTEHGRLEAERMSYENNIREREALVREIGSKHGLRGYENDLDEHVVEDFLAKIARMSRDQNQVLERIKGEGRQRIGEAQAGFNALINQKTTIEQKRVYAQGEIKATELKLKSLQRELTLIRADIGTETIAKDDLAARDLKLEKAKADFDSKAYDVELKCLQDKLLDIEVRKETITEELSKGSELAESRARLAILKQRSTTQQKAMSVLIAAKRDKFDAVTNRNWTEDTIEQELQRVLDERDEELQNAIRSREQVNSQISQVETRISTANERLKKIKQEAQKCEHTVLQAIPLPEDGNTSSDPNEYRTVLEELETERKNLQRVEYMRDHLMSALDATQKGKKDPPHCILCKRGISDGELPKITDNLRKSYKQYMDRAGKEYLQDLDRDLEEMRSAGPSYDSWIRLTQKEIPMLENELKNYRASKDNVIREFNEIEARVQDKINLKSECQSLQKSVGDIVKYRHEIQDSEIEIESLAETLSGIGGTRATDDIQRDLQSLSGELSSIKAIIRKKEGEKEQARQTIAGLERQVNDARKKLNDITIELMTSKTLTERMTECQDAIRRQTSIIEEVERDIAKLAPDILAAEARVREITIDANEKEKRQQRDASKLAQSDLNLSTIQQRIKWYVQQGGLQQLQKCQSEIESLKQMVEEANQAVSQFGDAVTALETDLAKADGTERSITDNLRFRQGQRDLEKILTDIDELEIQDAEAQRDRFTRDADALSNRHMRLSSEKSALAGEMRSKDKQLEQLIQDYATDFADAKEKYTETLAKAQTTTSAMNDLVKYGAALDKAVMKYHSLKMEEINRIIEELWKATYRGTDVDTILIRSESENEKKGNRSYNYRVAMVKQDAELDMRGRCSAGQRVLACIIIRLALAECFGINCGLIALDEPTTNLDSDNIKSLAKSLHGIIRTRMTQANFQLIVITHDEDFLKEMQCQEYCDHYYRVSRNDKQKSIIERQSIAEVV